LNFTNKEDAFSHYIDGLNHHRISRGEEDLEDIEWLEMLDTTHLLKSIQVIDMPSDDFFETGRKKIREEVWKQKHKSAIIKKPRNKFWKKQSSIVAVVACTLILLLQVQSFSPTKKVNAEQITVAKERELIYLGPTEANEPNILSDGQKISFEKNDTIAIWDPNSHDIKEFPLGSFQYMRSPAWSPDGKTIAFSGYKDGFEGIWIMNKNGTNITQLTFPSSRNEFHETPKWSRNGEKLAFTKKVMSSNYPHGFSVQLEEIWKMNQNGSQLKKVTNGSEPSWSPQSDKIAYTKTIKQGGAESKQIWLIDSHGENATKLTEGMEATWSPDGQFIAYTKYTTSKEHVGSKDEKSELVRSFREIWAIHVQSRRISQLTKTEDDEDMKNFFKNKKKYIDHLPIEYTTSGAFSDWQPSWSKDGKNLIFVRNTNKEKGKHFSLYKIDLKYE
jgi:TolB protein